MGRLVGLYLGRTAHVRSTRPQVCVPCRDGRTTITITCVHVHMHACPDHALALPLPPAYGWNSAHSPSFQRLLQIGRLGVLDGYHGLPLRHAPCPNRAAAHTIAVLGRQASPGHGAMAERHRRCAVCVYGASLADPWALVCCGPGPTSVFPIWIKCLGAGRVCHHWGHGPARLCRPLRKVVRGAEAMHVGGGEGGGKGGVVGAERAYA